MSEKIGCVQHDCAECVAREQRPWVGLTDEDVSNALTKYHGWREFAHELETILRGKNT